MLDKESNNHSYLAHYPAIISVLYGYPWNKWTCSGCGATYPLAMPVMVNANSYPLYLEHCPVYCLNGRIYCPIAEVAGLVLR